MFCSAARSEEPVYDIDVPAMTAAEALNRFAEQTGAIMLFSYDLARDRRANAVRGRYTLLEGLELLLRGTGLSGGLSDKRVVNISQTGNSQRLGEEAIVQKEKASWMNRVAAFVGSMFAVSVASGQDASSATQSLEEIVVTAQKRVERLQDVPIAMSVLEGVDLDRLSTGGATEALSRVPGVATSVSVQGGGTQITVRGVTASGANFEGSSPTAYYLDSMPFGLVKSAFAPDPNVYDLQRIEVLRGPQGTLYGASAQNGVVRVLTNPADLNGFELKGRAGLSSTDGGGVNYRADMAVNVPIVAGKLAARAVAGYENLRGWIDGAPGSTLGNDLNDSEQRSVRLKVDAQPTSKLTLGLSAWTVRNDHGAPPNSAEDGTVVGGLPQPMAIDYDLFGFQVGYEFAHISLASSTSYLRYDSDSFLDLSPPPFLFPAQLFSGFDSDVFSQEILLNSAQIEPWQWSAGVFYRDGEDRLQQNIPQFPGATYVDYSDFSESWAVFGELSRRFFGDALQWTLGMRHFEDEVRNEENSSDPLLPSRPLYRADNSFHSTTPRAVLTWYPSDDLTIYGSYSEGFRSGFPQNANIVQESPGFPPLRPDKLHNYEIGAKASLPGTGILLDAALYYIDWNDVQQLLRVNFNNLPTSAPVNGGDASGLGFDLAVTAQPGNGLEFGANLSWNDLAWDEAKFVDDTLLFDKGDRLNFSPEYTVGLFADYSFPVGRFDGRFATSANYTSKQIISDVSSGVRSVWIGDDLCFIRASLALSSADRWMTTLFAENVGNERGTSVNTAYGVADWSPRARPRTIGLQFESRF